MLDQRTFALLNVINQGCYDGGYKIFTIDEIISSFPPALIVDREAINESLKLLCKNEYISVKYQDQVEICVCSLSKGRRVLESRLENEIEKEQLEKRYFLYAFLGSFIGVIIASMLLLLLKFVGCA